MTHQFWKGKTREKSADQMKRKILSESINLQNSVLEPSHLKSSFRNIYHISTGALESFPTTSGALELII